MATTIDYGSDYDRDASDYQTTMAENSSATIDYDGLTKLCPLMWLCWALFCRDVELACDERVVKGLTPEGRADYAAALLKCSAPRRGFAPLAVGETGVRQRVKRALDYRRPAVWLGVLGALLCLLAAVFFLTDPPADAQGTASVSVRGV